MMVKSKTKRIEKQNSQEASSQSTPIQAGEASLASPIQKALK
jgi:hypothetical protein